MKIKYSVQELEYSVLYNKSVQCEGWHFNIIMCEGWHFTRMWKTLAWLHHFTKRAIWAPKTSLALPSLFIEVPVPSQESDKRTVMYICVGGCSFTSFYNFLIIFWNFFNSVVYFVIILSIYKYMYIFVSIPGSTVVYWRKIYRRMARDS